MKLHRFFGDFDLQKNKIEIFDEEICNQIKNVLRLGIGDKLILCDGKKRESVVQISAFGKGSVLFENGKTENNQNEPAKNIILYCSILKHDHFELVCQKATEVGASKIVPIICKHTVKKDIRTERVRKIIKEAAEQSGRGKIPVLGEVIEFSKALENAGENEINIIFDASGKKFEPISTKNIGIFIGPEGGWDKTEIVLAKDKGFSIFNLGKLILRAETAAILGVFAAL